MDRVDFMRKHGITNRELEVLGLVMEGLTGIQIAKRLYISYYTVKRHFDNIRDKMYTKSIKQAGIYYYLEINKR